MSLNNSDQYANSDGRTRITSVPLVLTSIREGRIPLSPSQQRLWFLEQVHPGSAINHISMEVRLRGSVNPEVVERSVREIVRRHEILRTRFGSERGEGFAEVSTEAIVTIGRQDFQTLDPAEQEIQIRQCLQAKRSQPFDMRRGPLFRVTLLALEQDVHILALTFHRLFVSSGGNWRFFGKPVGMFKELDSPR
jgi:hypothetical protein